MKKLLALLLVLFNLTTTALAADIPYLDRVHPDYRAAAQGFIFNYTSDAALANAAAMQETTAQGRETVIVPAQGGEPAVTLYVYRPAGSADKPLPVVYYSHGGGYLFRKALDYTERFQSLADNTGAAVITVDYRLSTEAPFPAALTDAYNGLLYIKQNAHSLGLDGDNIVLMGDSAGGGLSASLALYNRDNANIPLKGQVLIYPMLDYRTGTAESPYSDEYTGHICWPRATNAFAWQKLRSDAEITGKMLPYFSPAMADDLTSLPPALIYVGSLDLFANEDLAYANKLVEDGNTATLYLAPGLYHAFELANPNAQPTHDFWQRIYSYTKAQLAE